MPVKINLGCGLRYLEGYINCDVSKEVKADKYFDADSFPYPLESGIADEILMDNVMEHLDEIPRVMQELYRILKSGGVLRVMVPYGKSDWALQDPTHKHFFTEKTLQYFCGEEGSPAADWYAKRSFRLQRAELTVDSNTLRHKLRNAIPFRSALRYFLTNMYDGITFELVKP